MKETQSILDPLCARYDNSFKPTSANFQEAKEDILGTIEKAIISSRNDDTLKKYREMHQDAANITTWPKLMSFLWHEKLARDGLKTIK